MPEIVARADSLREPPATPLRFSPCRYIIVIAEDPSELVKAIRAVAGGAIRERRIHVVRGDRGRETFPTREATAAVQRFFNVGGSAPNPADRVRELTVLVHNFFSRNARTTVEHRAVNLALKIGYNERAVQAVRTSSIADLHAMLRLLGVCDAADCSTEPKSLVEALERFRGEFTDARVADRAVESAKAFETTHGALPEASRVLEDLRAVHRTYGRLQDMAGASIHPRERIGVLKRAIGQTLGSEQSGTAANHRRFQLPDFGDHTVECRLHLRYNFHYARIYFWFAPPSKSVEEEPVRTVVCHAGDHLP